MVAFIREKEFLKEMVDSVIRIYLCNQELPLIEGWKRHRIMFGQDNHMYFFVFYSFYRTQGRYVKFQVDQVYNWKEISEKQEVYGYIIHL